MNDPPVLPSGTTIRRNPDRLVLPPHLRAFIRLTAPYDLFLSAGCGLQLDRTSMLENRGPVTTHAEVVVHKTGTDTYIVLVPRNDAANQHAEPLTGRNNSRGGAIRTAGDVLMEAGIVLQPRWHYYVKTTMVQLEGFGWVVSGNWTQATAKPPKAGARAAGAAETEATEAERSEEVAREEATASRGPTT